MTDRQQLSRDFLAAAGWGAARRQPLAGDASDRRYERLTLGRRSAVLMDAPPGKGDDPADFLRIGRHLRGLGLSAPDCLAEDLPNGFLLLEDLGDGVFARVVLADPALEMPLYTLATDALAHLQAHPAPPGLPNLTAKDWAEAAAFALDWYRFAVTGDRVATGDFVLALTEALTDHADGPRVLILRDFHAENLMWLPERAGLARVGLLDFQLGQMGQPVYDLVSLLQDARRDVGGPTDRACMAAFAARTGTDDAAIRRAATVFGAQRALRILGIFARLCLVGGKPGYLSMMPRVWGQLQQNLAAPELSGLRRICDDLLPPPGPETLLRIGEKCGRFR